MEAKNNHIPWEHRGIEMAAKGGFHVVQMLQRNDSEKYMKMAMFYVTQQ